MYPRGRGGPRRGGGGGGYDPYYNQQGFPPQQQYNQYGPPPGGRFPPRGGPMMRGRGMPMRGMRPMGRPGPGGYPPQNGPYPGQPRPGFPGDPNYQDGLANQMGGMNLGPPGPGQGPNGMGMGPPAPPAGPPPGGMPPGPSPGGMQQGPQPGPAYDGGYQDDGYSGGMQPGVSPGGMQQGSSAGPAYDDGYQDDRYRPMAGNPTNMGPPGPPGPPQQMGGYGEMPPQRPSTAQDDRMYRGENGPLPQDGYGGTMARNSAEPVYGDSRPAALDEFYDYYGSNGGNNGAQPDQYPLPSRPEDYSSQGYQQPKPEQYPPPARQEDYNSRGYQQPNYDSQGYDYGSQGFGGYGPQNPDSYGQLRQTDPPELAQRGPGRVAELNRAKSQPDLRNSQTAVFEMAGDIPPMPSGGFPRQQPADRSPGAYAQSPATQQNQDTSMGQQGPPPPGPGLPPHPAPFRSNTMTSQNYRSDSLRSHPAPVRPGHMPNSLVNLSDRPPPVRNYSGSTYSGSTQAPSIAPSTASSSTLPPPQDGSTPPPPKPVEGPVTVEELERLRATIKRDPNDQASALRLAKKLVEAADVLVPNIPDQKARARSRDHYLMDANKILRKLEKVNNPDAMFFFADCLGRGLFSAEPDNAHAFTLYQSAAKLGHAAAAYRTAVCCEIGHDEGGGTRKDPLKAIQWYKRAATLGDTPAMYKVGMILLKGLLGQPVNPREAVSWLKRAAERADAENPHALHELALLYEDTKRNDIVIPDPAYALQLFTQAANLGYKFSQFRLGWAYEFGLMGCPIRPDESIKWYSLAAQQGEHQSELALSGWYLTGSEGVLAPNDTEAYLWARKAAVAGLAKAEYAMGYYTQKGIGVAPNIEDAKRWYWRAAAQDYPKARQQLEMLKRTGGKDSQQRERISRSKIAKQGEGECSVM